MSISGKYNREGIKMYDSLSKTLSDFTEQKMCELILNAKPFHTSLWSTSLLLNLSGTTVFVKKIPLTHIERLPNNFRSTKNIFELPTYYQ